MLAGVLLHIIEPADPIDDAGHLTFEQRRGEDMGDAVLFVHHIGHRNPVDSSKVVRLAARGWIERGLLQIETAAIGRRLLYD